ncbi:hypothetical protein [Rhodocyclus tenuis]|uniref:hypothetical protein n=1 Tax=Rhodocyclus tenuis TaxID=1066 RepID=UPI001905C70D|nr:hypothetical protein [Rhodocyclus tenuis]
MIYQSFPAGAGGNANVAQIVFFGRKSLCALSNTRPAVIRQILRMPGKAGRSAYTRYSPNISSAISGSTIMGKQRQSNKEAKKEPLHNAKEKKAAKQAKKHAGDIIQPLIPHGTAH